MEEGETFARAAARELREETGLDATVTDLAMHQSYRVPDEMRAEYETKNILAAVARPKPLS